MEMYLVIRLFVNCICPQNAFAQSLLKINEDELGSTCDPQGDVSWP